MCWTGKLEQCKIAEEEIPIIKIIDKCIYNKEGESDRFKYFSPIQSKQKWVFNEPVSSELTMKQVGDKIEISHGLHSFNPNISYEILESGLKICGITFKSNKYIQVVVCEGYIPKGSIYFDNGKTLVSTKIILTNEQ